MVSTDDDSVTAGEIKVAKDKRSRLKARLSTLTKQLSTQHTTNHDHLYEELNYTYSDFLESHFILSELALSDTKFAELGTVSGLNLDDYLDQVVTC